MTSQIPPILSIMPYGNVGTGMKLHTFLNIRVAWHGVFHMQQNQSMKYLSDPVHDQALGIIPGKLSRFIHPVLEV